jgi:ABC-type amino acid transport substrate-binding protein
MALEKGNVNYMLPWVPKKAEAELKEAFEKTVQARKQGKEAMEIADYWLFETAVRLHREGEGAPYTGLKPAGLDWGPVVPRAEKAIETGNPEEVVGFIAHAAEHELKERFNRAMARKKYDVNDVDAAREYVQAELGFVLYSHGLYAAIAGRGEHGEEGAKKHGH